MDFAFPHELEEFRKEVQTFVKQELPDDWTGVDEDANPETIRPLRKKLSDKGRLTIAWPKEYGGQDGDQLSQYLVDEEFTRIGMQIGLAGGTGAAIMAAGTQEQKDYYLPRLISGEISFAQGFTEPSGGADLASLQTRAVRDGDFYVINGQKIFTSGAHTSTHIYMMVRTDPDAPKPGVRARPFRRVLRAR